MADRRERPAQSRVKGDPPPPPESQTRPDNTPKPEKVKSIPDAWIINDVTNLTKWDTERQDDFLE